MLETMGEHIEVDGIYLFRKDMTKQEIYMTYAWCVVGVSSKREDLKLLPLSRVSPWRDHQREGEDFYMVSPIDGREGAESLVLFPLLYEGDCKGFVGFDIARRLKAFTEMEIALLQIFAEIVANAKAKKEAEKALLESEKRYRTIVENTNDAILIHDFRGIIKDLNENARRLFGYEREELLGQHLSMITSSKDREEHLSRMGQLIKEKTLLFEAYDRRKDGTAVPVEVSAKVVSMEGDGLIQGFLRDITNRKKAEQQVREYTTELEERNLEIKSLYEYLDKEIERAKEIHQRTLPKSLPEGDGLSMAAYYQPAERLGGDFYDSIKRGHKLITYVSDVVGHGLESALLSSFVKDMVKSYVMLTPLEKIDPSGILHFLYEQYKECAYPGDYFVSIFVTVLDLETGEIEYLGAGNQDDPLLSIVNREIELKNNGLPISSALPYELLNFTKRSINLRPSATLLLYTDGITDQHQGKVFYGDRIKNVFFSSSHCSPSSIVKKIKEDFMEFNKGTLKALDDITFLVLHWEGKDQS